MMTIYALPIRIKNAFFILLLLGSTGLSAQSYCIPFTNVSCKDPIIGSLYYGNITNVTFAGLNNLSDYTNCGTTSRGYSDYSSSVAPTVLNADGITTYSFSISRHTTVNSNYRMAIWIDLNNDGIFDNTDNNISTNPTGERFLEAFMGNSSPITGNIILPAGIASGDKRMRVRAMYTQTGYTGPSPCATQDYGEAEDYTITVSGAAASSITTGSLGNTSYCPESALSIPFTITGSFDPANVFSAQLSDASGNFSIPVTLGTLNGSSQGSVNGTIPANTPAGSNYRIRVISSNPAITGLNNNNNITILQNPQIPLPTSSATSICPLGTVTLTANPSPSTAIVTWLISTNGTSFNPLNGASGSPYTSAPISQTTWYKAVATNSCGTVESEALQIAVSNVSQITIIRSPETYNLCNGDITLSVPSSITNFTWNNNQSGNSLTTNTPGTYSGSGIDASGCQANATEVIIIRTNPPELTTDPAGVFSTCSNSTLLNASQGFETYHWSNGQEAQNITINNTGIYAVTGTDTNGCKQTSDSVFVTFDNSIPALITVTPESPTFYCNGETVTLSAEEGYDTYIWTGDINGRTIEIDQPGIYSVSGIKEDGCQGKSGNIEVLQKEIPVAAFSYAQPSGYLVVFTNESQGENTYTWLISGSTTTSVNASFTFPFDGIYPVTLIANNECGLDTLIIDVEVKKIVGIPDELGTFKLNAYYQQESGKLYLLHSINPSEISLIRVTNAIGQLVYNGKSITTQDQSLVIDLSSLAPGIYTCLVHTSNGTGITKFMIH